MNLRPLITLIIICMSSQVLSEGDDHASHEAHVHGEAEMTLILQGDELVIKFESPSANIVGFEHQPETEKQVNSIDTAMLNLQDPTSWLQFDGGSCELKSSAAQTNLRSDHSDEAHTEHHEGHADVEHDDHVEDNHTDFSAEYQYSCANAANLESITVTLQSIYPAIERIEAQWIINGKQGLIELETGNNKIAVQ